MNSLRSGLDSANATNSSSLIAAKRGRNARLKVGTRTAAAGISSMKRISARIAARLHRIARREVRPLRRDLVEIFDDDGGIDHDLAVVVERRHHAVRIEREIFGLELIAGEQVELLLLERQPLGVEHEAHALAAGRLRRVVELEGHKFTEF